MLSTDRKIEAGGINYKTAVWAYILGYLADELIFLVIHLRKKRKENKNIFHS